MSERECVREREREMGNVTIDRVNQFKNKYEETRRRSNIKSKTDNRNKKERTKEKRGMNRLDRLDPQ